MKFNRFPALILIVMLALASITPILADDHEDPPIDDEEIELSICGEVAFDGDEITVAGVVVAPAGAFNPADFEDGDVLGLIGYFLGDGDTLQATGYVELEDIEDCDVDDEGDDLDATEEPDATEEALETATEEPDDGDDNCEGSHPVATVLADEFDDYTACELEEWHAEGLGYGNVARILLIADQLDMDAEEIFGMMETGGGWGQIMRELDIDPSDLAPGRVISGRFNLDDEDVEFLRGNARKNREEREERGNRNGNGNRNGRGGNRNSNGNRNGNSNRDG